MTAGLDMAPIEARLAELDRDPERDTLQQLAALARDVPVLAAEVRRLQAAELAHLGMLGQAFAESARQVRETASMDTRAGSLPADTPVLRLARVDALADRLDRQAEAALVLADQAVPR